ncbi:MAG: C1 family peptidase [Bdellovibrionota bacterium]
MKNFFLLFTIAISLSASFPAFAINCQNLYALTAAELAAVKPKFLAKHNTSYTYEVKATSIKNQCQYGGCWIYGSVANAETQLLTEQGIAADLSEQYLIMRSLQERSVLALEQPGYQLAEGGFYGGALRLIRDHGIVPNEVWQPRIPFETQPHKNRLLSFLNHRIAKFHLYAAKYPLNKASEMEVAKADLQEILTAYTGAPPTSFTFRGVEYESPKAFAESLFPNKAQSAIKYKLKKEGIPDVLEKAKPAKGYNTPTGTLMKISEIEADYERIERAIVDSIKNGRSVVLSTEMANEFIDKKLGIMSPRAFHIPDGFEPVPAAYRDAFNIAGGGHQMEIVGVDLDDAGRVIKYKIKNSWGSDSGDQGFYHMYPDYFRIYVKSVTVP